MPVKGLLPPRGVFKNRSKGSRPRKTHSKSDGVKYSTQQQGTTTIAPPRATQSGSCYLNSMRRPQTPHNQISKQPPGRIDDPSTNTDRHTMPLTIQYTTHARARTQRTAQQDPSMDHASAPQHTMQHHKHPNNMAHPATGAPHTPYVSLMRCWTMNFQRDSSP